MRLKEFIILLIVFTIIYFGFFKIIDLFSNKKMDKSFKLKINIDSYKIFARFYGIESTITIETLLNIQSVCSTISFPTKITSLANKFSLSQYEFIVCFLFFEYLNLLPKKTFIFDNDLISNPNMIDLNLVNKYSRFFIEKKSLDEIIKVAGGNTINDIIHLNQLFLIPGVRYINNQLYYVGDMNETN